MSEGGRGRSSRGKPHYNEPVRRPGNPSPPRRNEATRNLPPADASAAPHPYPSGSGIVVGRGLSRGRLREEGGAPGQHIQETTSVVATRPSRVSVKEGREGAPLRTMTSNFFELLSKPNVHFLQYRVDFTPEIEHNRLKMGLLYSHEQVLGKHVFDGTLLYCTSRLPQPLELFSNRRSDNSVVGIKLRLVGELCKEDSNYINVLNIIIRRCLKMLNMTMIKRDYYDSEARIPIPKHNVEIWPGYLTTIRYHENGYLLGVEIVHRIMRQDTALKVMQQIHRNDPSTFYVNCKAELEGQVVMTHYNKKTYRIDEVSEDHSPLSTFHYRKEDREITYMEYYETRYQLRINDTTQRLLISRPTRRDINRGEDKPIFLIPELCGMTGLTEAMRKDFRVTQDLACYTRVDPDRRVQSLLSFRRRLQNTEAIQRELNGWGLSFANDLVSCRGRCIGDSIKIASGRGNFDIRNNDWTRDLDRAPMARTVELLNWVVFVPRELSNQARNFVKEMEMCGRAQSFRMGEPRYIEMDRDRINDYTRHIVDHCSQNQYNIALIVKRTRKIDDIYKAIKRLVCCDLGIPAQVVTGPIINKAPHQMKAIATKVMVQIAAKLGAEPWRTSFCAPDDQHWMVIGFDTFHDAKQKRAVGAFVASVNRSFTRYVSSVKKHENNEDMSPCIYSHFTECVKAFYKENRTFPTHIFFYRDGVGAGDIELVKQLELEGIKKACVGISRIVGTNFNPGIAFIIVSKRINTRFFQNNGRGSTNPPCGTVVDNTVTLVERNDFFLVSQKANQGTVSPTSYNIIEDTTGLTPDRHQQLAYALTHLYYNWTGNLRVPAPIQYAHKLAYLVGESDFIFPPRPELANLPYFL